MQKEGAFERRKRAMHQVHNQTLRAQTNIEIIFCREIEVYTRLQFPGRALKPRLQLRMMAAAAAAAAATLSLFCQRRTFLAAAFVSFCGKTIVDTVFPIKEEALLKRRVGCVSESRPRSKAAINFLRRIAAARKRSLFSASLHRNYCLCSFFRPRHHLLVFHLQK